jgi:uncharacterized protein YutE (UPF0331/DUF86 family)
MFVYREVAEKILQTHAQDILSSLKNNISFLDELNTRDDDWAFVIKAQALIEGAVTRAILAQIGDDRIKRTVEVLPLVGEELSKLALMKDFNLITRKERRFISKMASLRNRLAHRAEYSKFNFKDHVDSLDGKQLKDWQDSIVWFTEANDSGRQWKTISATHTRTAIYLAVFLLVTLLDMDRATKAKTRKILEAADLTVRDIPSRENTTHTDE